MNQTTIPTADAAHTREVGGATTRGIKFLEQYNSIHTKRILRSESEVAHPGDFLSDSLQLVLRLGEGASGQVWEAFDWISGRLVAVKRTALESAEFQATFLAEAKRLARISSPHVYAIYDAFATAAGCVVVMERLHVETLQDRLKDLHREGASMAWDDACELIRGILAGLRALHEATDKPLFHCDLKPANIGFGLDGTVKLLDVALPAPLFGSPGWQAPEQLDSELAGPETDLFGVGLIAAVMLSGKHPFGDPNRLFSYRELVFDHPPRGLDGLARPFQLWIRKLLEIDPEDRFRSAEEALIAFEQL